MLNQVNDEPKISACRSARILAAEPTFRDQCADMGITTKIVALLSSTNLEVRRQAILTIGELIKNNETNMGIISSNKGTFRICRSSRNSDSLIFHFSYGNGY